ncbi:hypothetical protein SCORR_v1c01670 [Spiroplasma corruscae]|uniref:Transmembrane protein n=1 Tax=Spiroplasma corruscae TaxID=216934 RepID=A0A222EN74_9MOLU|nr:hypothetical protein [Spiroplasma corruscae]ASP27942.1 hypothetical protein SCORR_v1c01670 [Spiroplasma corruscae]
MVRTGRSMGSIRFMLVIANIFGIIAGVFGIGALIYLLQMTFKQGVSSEDLKNIFDNIDAKYIPILFGFIGFVSIGNIYYCAFLINFIRKSDDDTLINNRWILAVFSLSVGGVFTPIVLAQMPNVNVKSTISPKFTISKGYGFNALIAPLGGLAFYLLFTKAINLGYELNQISIIFYSVIGLMMFWGVLNIMLFALPNSKEAWNKKGSQYTFMNLVATINMIYATIILMIQIIISIWSIITIISDLVGRRGNSMSFINALLAPLRIAMQLFIIFTIIKTIKGLWAKSDSFEYGVYTNLSEKQRNYEMNR